MINPVHAGSVFKKTDVVDAHRLCLMDLTGIWNPFYVISDEIAALRVLIAERNNYGMLRHVGATVSIRPSLVLESLLAMKAVLHVMYMFAILS